MAVLFQIIRESQSNLLANQRLAWWDIDGFVLECGSTALCIRSGCCDQAMKKRRAIKIKRALTIFQPFSLKTDTIASPIAPRVRQQPPPRHRETSSPARPRPKREKNAITPEIMQSPLSVSAPQCCKSQEVDPRSRKYSPGTANAIKTYLSEEDRLCAAFCR